VIAVGDIMERIIPFMTIGQKRIAMSIVWLVAMLPLSCLKTMKSLECASSVGIVSIITLLVAATVHLIHHIHEQHGDNNSDSHIDNDYDYDAEEELLFSPSPSFLSLIGPANGSWLSVLQACPIFFYAFSCQVNVAQIFHELPPAGSSNSATGSEGKIKKMSLVTVTGVLVCGLLYASVSLVTLLDFGKDMKPNILSCYELNNRSDPLLHIAFLAMALAVVMAFPLNIFPARVSIIMMWENNKKFDNSIIDQQQQQQIICCGIGGGGGIEEQVKQPLLSKDHHNSNDNNSDYNSVGDTTMDVEDPLRSPSTITQQQQQQHDVNIIIDVEVDVDGQQEENHEEEFHFFQHLAVTLLLAGTALGFALVIPNISVVFGLLGGTTSSLLGFIVPGLLGLQLDRTRISCWVLVICGSIIAVLTTTVTVYSMFRS
jgi:amino acid permease